MTSGLRPPPVVPVVGLPRWYRAMVAEVMTRYRHGQVWTCDHAPAYRLGLPVAAATWEPGLVVCGRCVGALDVEGQAAVPHCCEICREAGAAPYGTRHGRLLLFALLCPRCRGWLRVAKSGPLRHVRGSGRRRAGGGR
ncbi:hypothetical protein CcI49_06765 [Frankia sp. CcI49]|uniref:hypothetical protein n=1 Tax=Frankia sp. CcI49 TaxID=1745382 RepID=UPI0009D017DC|nr:hypothetical protein [Frankia sp. CcI49]ONH61285.1 hypothetical protein CcI49_06765 [Frankia sp. CcI49]